MLVTPMNPCRCGHTGYSCKRRKIDRRAGDYQARISGRVMDRLGLQLPALTTADLILPPPAEFPAQVATRVPQRAYRLRSISAISFVLSACYVNWQDAVSSECP
jgi:predicted ATPase with chaperone activity